MIKIKLIYFFVFILCFGTSFGKYNFCGQGSYLNFFGKTELSHFGGGLKLEYEYNDWAVFYGSGNYFAKQDYTAVVEAEAFADGTRPYLVDIPVPSSVFFIQAAAGLRVYFYGEVNPIKKGAIGLYGIGEFSLLIGTSDSQVNPGPEYDDYNVPFTGQVKGSFWNYTGSLGVGAEKQIGRPFVFVESKFNAKIDEANAFSVSTKVPFGLSYFIGLRIPLSAYD